MDSRERSDVLLSTECRIRSHDVSTHKASLQQRAFHAELDREEPKSETVT